MSLGNAIYANNNSIISLTVTKYLNLIIELINESNTLLDLVCNEKHKLVTFNGFV